METGESLTDRLVIGPSDIPSAAGRVWESSYYPVRQADGHLLGVGVVTREISQKLRDEKAIKESEARFRSLAEAMPQIVWVGQPDGFLEYINPNWYDYSGLTEEQSLGWGWLDSVHADDRDHSRSLWLHSTRTGADYEVTYRLREIGRAHV